MKTVETGRLVDDAGIASDTLAAIILKAKAFDATVPESDPAEASNDSDDREISVLEDQPDNPARADLAGSINGLADDEQEALVALTWIGRGDFSAGDWDAARKQAAERAFGPTSDYLCGIPMLGNYLETGADELGINVSAAETSAMSHPDNPDPARAVK